MIEDPRRAAAVAIGDELIHGLYPDLNCGTIARELLPLGIDVERFVVVGDDRAQLSRTLGELCSEYSIVVASGGLGPTLDDITREAAAEAAGVQLERSSEVESFLRDYFRRLNRPMPESNLRQADFPAGAQIIPNRVGSAPGFRVWIEGGMLAALPGPPKELSVMLREELIPWLQRTCGEGPPIESRTFSLVGLPESQFADEVGDWMARSANPLVTVTSHYGILRARIIARGASRRGVRELIERRSAEFRQRFADHIFADDEDFAGVVGRALLERQLTVATAESCTGGAVARLLTSVPGISAVFREGWVTYSDEAKQKRLGVPHELLEAHGAVSSEVAAAMAAGAAEAADARMAVSVTGIAGPGGAVEGKPVGTVHFGIALDGEVQTLERHWRPVGRDAIRRYAAHTALELLWRRALTQPFASPGAEAPAQADRGEDAD